MENCTKFGQLILSKNAKSLKLLPPAPDFKAKMHQIRFRLGLCPRHPARGAHSAPPDLLAGFKGLLLRGRSEGE